MRVGRRDIEHVTGYVVTQRRGIVERKEKKREQQHHEHDVL
jgi:hypothetical protein